MRICMYVCMYACMYVCMYASLYPVCVWPRQLAGQDGHTETWRKVQQDAPQLGRFWGGFQRGLGFRALVCDYTYRGYRDCRKENGSYWIVGGEVIFNIIFRFT